MSREAGTCSWISTQWLVARSQAHVSYIVNAGRLAVDTDDQLGALPLLLPISLAIDFSGNDISVGVVQRLGQSRQHIRPVYLVFRRHFEYQQPVSSKKIALLYKKNC